MDNKTNENAQFYCAGFWFLFGVVTTWGTIEFIESIMGGY